jgi:hypothetical protein
MSGMSVESTITGQNNVPGAFACMAWPMLQDGNGIIPLPLVCHWYARNVLHRLLAEVLG